MILCPGIGNELYVQNRVSSGSEPPLKEKAGVLNSDSMLQVLLTSACRSDIHKNIYTELVVIMFYRVTQLDCLVLLDLVRITSRRI
jgi:hypothetical protein